MPQLSIITVNYNNFEGLKKTMRSVLEQDWADMEYIVIDGGSSDGSAAHIEKNSEALAYWVSEKDGGIYNAMNKGIAVAKGKYLQFLNSGDFYLNEKILSSVFCESQTSDIIYGHYVGMPGNTIFKMPAVPTFRFFYKQSFNHQACFIKKDLFTRAGLYNEKTPIIADWEFFLKAIFLYNATLKYLNYPLVYFDFADSMSNKKENVNRIIETRKKILNTYFPLIVKDMEYIDAVENSQTYRAVQSITAYRKIFSK